MTAVGGDHVVQVYEDDHFLCDTVALLLAVGLDVGQPLIVIATEAHRAAFRERLEGMGFDTAAACERGQLVLLDARETLDKVMVGDSPDWQRFDDTLGGVLERYVRTPPSARVRAYSEMGDLLCRDGKLQAAIRLEELWKELGRTHTFSLLCAYVDKAPTS